MLIRKIALVVANSFYTCVRNQYGSAVHCENIIDGLLRRVSQINQDVKAIHFFDEQFSNGGESAFLHTVCRASPFVVVKMSEANVAHSCFIKFIQVDEVAFEWLSSFKAKHSTCKR